MQNAANVWWFADEGVSFELDSLGGDSISDSMPFIDTGNHGFFFSGGVDVEEESGGGIESIGSAFDVEIIFLEFIWDFADLLGDPINSLHEYYNWIFSENGFWGK